MRIPKAYLIGPDGRSMICSSIWDAQNWMRRLYGVENPAECRFYDETTGIQHFEMVTVEASKYRDPRTGKTFWIGEEVIH